MRASLLVLFAASCATACAAGGSDGSPEKTDARGDGAGGDAIFPLDDGAVDPDAPYDSSADSFADSSTDSFADSSADSAAPDTGVDTGVIIDTAPSCGTPGLACCSGACSSGYCFSGNCYEKPTCIEEGSDPGMCSDLGVTHVKPAFFARFTVKGRPGASAYRYYKKVSCAGATAKVTPDSPFTLATDGTFTYVIENTTTPSCTNANLGRYEVWMVIDGVETTHQFTSVFNSLCPTYSTCASAASACP